MAEHFPRDGVNNKAVNSVELNESVDFRLRRLNSLHEDHLGGCPRIEAVARGSGFETIFSIKRGEDWVYLTILIGKMGQHPLFRSRLSILGQPPS